MGLIFILAQSLQNGFDMVGSILLKRVVIRVRKFKTDPSLVRYLSKNRKFVNNSNNNELSSRLYIERYCR